MRNIIAGLFISLDGVAEAPGTWHFPYFNDEMGGAVEAIWSRSDTMLLGRKSWQEFASYWPEHPEADGAEIADSLGHPAGEEGRPPPEQGDDARDEGVAGREDERGDGEPDPKEGDETVLPLRRVDREVDWVAPGGADETGEGAADEAGAGREGVRR